MSDNEVTPEFLASFTQAWNDHDVDKLMEHMAEDCVFMASVGTEVDGTKWEGFENVRKGFASLWDGYPDAHFEPIGEDLIVGSDGQIFSSADDSDITLTANRIGVIGTVMAGASFDEADNTLVWTGERAQVIIDPDTSIVVGGQGLDSDFNPVQSGGILAASGIVDIDAQQNAISLGVSITEKGNRLRLWRRLSLPFRP